MAVPEHIRKVPRPRNTVVIDSGSNGAKRYAVHSRRASICKPGCNPRPVNGPVIGHIIDGKFVPRQSAASLAEDGPDYPLTGPRHCFTTNFEGSTMSSSRSTTSRTPA